MKDNPALIERLTDIAHHAQILERGEKSSYLAAKAEELDISVSTLYRKLEIVTVKDMRKKRSDAGVVSLCLGEAQIISATVMEAMRKNGKRIMTVERAVNMLRANDMIKATYINKQGQEVKLSIGSIVRALRAYRLHPDQLTEPAPVQTLKSLHPNHVWQIDPSLCVLYYLPRQGKDSGLRVMKHDEFYKNKPANVAKIVNDRVWRYTGTDHASGVIYCHYYFGGETSANLCDFFIRMMSPKSDIGTDPFRGKPVIVMLDPGSANTSSAFKTLCSALDVQVQINKPNNPRAKGQVEKANDIVETAFESGLKFVSVQSIDKLNALCDKWLRYYNGREVHSRHGMTRYAAWQKISSEQLILPPPADYCKTLALSIPKEAKVMPTLEIKYSGSLYDVSSLISVGVVVGQKVLVAQNPWEVGGVRVCHYDKDGAEVWTAVPKVEMDEMGFRVGSAIIGQEYKAHSETVTQTHAKDMEKLIMRADTLTEATTKRKAKHLPFDGKIDPYKHNDDMVEQYGTLYMPKRGQAMPYNQKEVAEPILSKVEIAKELKPKIEVEGGNWAMAVALLQNRYPDGIRASELGVVYEELLTASHFRLLKKQA